MHIPNFCSLNWRNWLPKILGVRNFVSWYQSESFSRKKLQQWQTETQLSFCSVPRFSKFTFVTPLMREQCFILSWRRLRHHQYRNDPSVFLLSIPSIHSRIVIMVCISNCRLLSKNEINSNFVEVSEPRAVFLFKPPKDVYPSRHAKHFFMVCEREWFIMINEK